VPQKGDLVNIPRLSELVLLAAAEAQQGAGAGGAAGGQGGNPSLFPWWLPLVAIFILFYFLLLRPQRKEQSRRQDMLAKIKKNDRVVTVGGIYGVVTNIQRESDEVTIKVDEATNAKIRVTVSAIARVVSEETAEETAKK
jgi:preprotein translocase subunit YajC